MPSSLAELEAGRNELLQQFLSLGDFRPGTVSAAPRRCGKPGCHCAEPDKTGHPQLRVLRKVKGKTVAESFASPTAFQRAAEQISEFHRFQQLIAKLTVVNEQICQLRPLAPETSGWTAAEKKRLLLFIRKSRGKSTHSSR